MITELYSYNADGELITAQELLQREWGREVSEDEAVEVVRRHRFISNFINYAKHRKVL